MAANDGPAVSTYGLDVTQLVAGAGPTITIPTGYPAPDLVEPSILLDDRAPFMADAAGKNGYEYVFCGCPYYLSNAALENPCLWVSHDGNTWYPIKYTAGIGVVDTAYAGGYTVTPVVAGAVQGDGNLSDAWIGRGPDGTYYILFNQVLVATGSGGTGTGGNTFAIKGVSASSLAGPWTTPVTIRASIATADQPATPSAFWDGSKWVIYAIDIFTVASAPPVVQFTSASLNLLAATWVKQANPAITYPAAYSATRGWFHLNAYRWGTKHLLLIQDFIISGSSNGNLWMVSSDDGGATWTVPARPFLQDWRGYRSAVIVSQRGTSVGFDLFAGNTVTSYHFQRSFLSFGETKYGGVNPQGIPVNALAVSVAKVPLPPYLFGDSCKRADNAATPGSADSGQAWVVGTGTLGILANKIYAPGAVNSRATVAVTAAADGVYSCEFSTVPTVNGDEAWMICRYVDSGHYVRIGCVYTTAVGGATWQLQEIGGAAATVFTGKIAKDADVVTAVCSGSTVTVYVNGVPIGPTVTGLTVTQAGSAIGVQTASTVPRFCNFTVRPLVNGA